MQIIWSILCLGVKQLFYVTAIYKLNKQVHLEWKKKSQILIVPEFLVILLIWEYLIYFQYLNLLNGERLYLSEYVKLIFETDDLTDASPATVSRCVSAVISLQSTVEPPLTAMHLRSIVNHDYVKPLL